ncbi:MAG: ankyrin repeat domain-containing protein [Chloroflexota bacterium]|nr:ankyrin repeat domain-containing protein [Chloroflexota bacterium]
MASASIMPFYRVPKAPTELMRAAIHGDVNELKRLLDTGVDVNERRGYSTRLGLMLGHGPSIPKYGETALLFAIDSRNREAVRTLLDGGADTEVKDSAGKGIWEHALENAFDTGSDVLLLLANRFPVPPNLPDRILNSAQPGDQLVNFALGLHPSEDAREAALCNASRNGDIASMDLLLQTFAKPPPKAFDCAMLAWGSSGSSEMGRRAVDYLIAYGADPSGYVVPAYPPDRSRYSCPLICIEADDLRRCAGGCAAPISGTNGNELGGGYWIRGSGSNGRMEGDSHFELTLRKFIDEKLIECTFTIDARLLGPRRPPCAESFGSVRVTVMPQ